MSSVVSLVVPPPRPSVPYNERAIAERAIGTRPERAYMCVRTRAAPPTRFFPNAARSRTHIPERAPERSQRSSQPGPQPASQAPSQAGPQPGRLSSQASTRCNRRSFWAERARTRIQVARTHLRTRRDPDARSRTRAIANARSANARTRSNARSGTTKLIEHLLN